jgi:hypothetical protein
VRAFHGFLILTLALALLALGCSEEEIVDDTPADDDACADGELALTDAGNYSYLGALDIASYPVAELTDITVDWSGLTLDMQGHELVPDEDIDTAAAVVFRYLSEEEIEEDLTADSLFMKDVALYVFDEVTGQTSVNLSELTLFGTDIDVETYFEASYGTWLIPLATGTTPGTGYRMAAFLVPTPGEITTEVFLTNDSMVLQVEADLTSLQPIELPADATPTIDWAGLTVNGMGNEIDLGKIDQVMVGTYADLTAADLEEQLLDLELIHDGMWTYDMTAGGSSLDLGLLTDEAGDAFTGISAEGTWILALRCGSCANPAPLYLGILQPCE